MNSNWSVHIHQFWKIAEFTILEEIKLKGDYT